MMADPITDSAGGAEFVDGAWRMKSPQAGAVAQAGANPMASGGNSGGFGYDPSSFNRTVQAITPGSGQGPQDINNQRFDQWADQGSTDAFQKYLQGQGFNSGQTNTNFSGAGQPMDAQGNSVQQRNLNMNGNLFNSAQLQSQYESNGRNPNGSFNTDFANKWLQDQLNSNGYGGSQQTPFADGQVYGMGGENKLTNTGINYNNGQASGLSANRGAPVSNAGGSGGNQPGASTNSGGGSNPWAVFGVNGPGQSGQISGGQGGGWPSASQSMQPQGQGGMSGGMSGWGGGQMGRGQMYGGGMGMQQRRPQALGGGYGGFGGGMQNSQWYPQSEPNMRPGMASNFQNQYTPQSSMMAQQSQSQPSGPWGSSTFSGGIPGITPQGWGQGGNNGVSDFTAPGQMSGGQLSANPGGASGNYGNYSGMRGNNMGQMPSYTGMMGMQGNPRYYGGGYSGGGMGSGMGPGGMRY